MPRDSDTPTVTIVRGAWVDAASWREVIALLHVKGLSVIAVQNPLSALAEDVDAVTRAISRQPGPVVLVGHGYGGTAATRITIGQWSKQDAVHYRKDCRRRADAERQGQNGHNGECGLASQEPPRTDDQLLVSR